MRVHERCRGLLYQGSAGLIVAPIILIYQAWTYYVFRARVGGEQVEARPAPEAGGSPA